MPDKDRPDESPTTGQPPGNPPEAGATVITPAGPTSRERVHPVAPNEKVRRNPDGSYTVEPVDPQRPQ